MQEGGVRAAFLIDHFYKQAPLFGQSEHLIPRKAEL
jgi:hypothetical protein